jgi:peptidoglycan/xylan/chitin deacetylase (PgdA/CDA1 family)
MKAAGLQLFAEALHRSKSSSIVSRAPSWHGVLVLNYHRIGNPDTTKGFRDVYSATAADFDHHLSFLKRNADVISGDDLPKVMDRGKGRHVLITFDDGYRDNYELAFPLLKKHGLTATFFICTGLVDRSKRAWWDDIAYMAGQSARPDFAANRDEQIAGGIAGYRALPAEKTGDFLDRFSERTGVDLPAMTAGNPEWMTWDMIREMRAGGMTIGAHTISHPILSSLSPHSQLAEIQGSRDRVAAELGEQPRLFAYPIGKPATFNSDTIAALKISGFDFAFSFYGGHQPLPTTHPYDVRRSNVNWRMSRSFFEAKVALPGLFARW